MATTDDNYVHPRTYYSDNTACCQTESGVAGSYTFNDYQDATSTTAIYPEKGTGNTAAINYCILGLIGEAGEIANKWKKWYRDGQSIPSNSDAYHARLLSYKAELSAELGDVLWYASQLATELGYDLGDVAADNIRKLHKRRRDGKLHGSGDNR